MKISKIAVAVLFTAGFLTTSASASMATSCAVGYVAVEGVFPDPMYTCEPIDAVEAVDGDVEENPIDDVDGSVEVKPIESCWTTEDGSDVCARGVVVPPPVVAEEEVPVEVSAYCMPEEGEDVCNDVLPIPKEATLEDGSVTRDGEQVDAPVDETLMFQSGVAMPASGSEPSSSNMLAAVGVLVGALGALGIGISRQREAK